MVSKRTEPDRYDGILAGAKPAKGERAAIDPYLEPDEALLVRQSADVVAEVAGNALGEADERVLLNDEIVVVVTDRKIIFARTSGGFRPQWELFSLAFGHLEPGVVAGGKHVSIPTSGRRSYRVQLPGIESALRLADALSGSSPPRTAATGWVWMMGRSLSPATLLGWLTTSHRATHNTALLVTRRGKN